MRISFFVFLTACNSGFEYPTDKEGDETQLTDADADADADSDADADADGDADADVDADADADADADPDEEFPYHLLVDPMDIDFGAVSVDSVGTQLVHVENIGTEAVHLNGLGVSDTSVFEITPDFGLPVTLSPGMERTIRVDFTPNDATTYVGEITFITDPEEPLAEDVDVTLRGSGDTAPCDICAPIIDVSPRSLTLNSLLGCTESGTVTVSNNGDRPLSVTGVNVINDPIFTCGTFTRTWSGSTVLAPGSSTSITVTYTATSECADYVDLDADWNTMHIISNDPTDPDFTVDLNGAATCLF